MDQLSTMTPQKPVVMAKTTEEMLAEHKAKRDSFKKLSVKYHKLRKQYIVEKRELTDFERKYQRVIELFT